MSEVFPDPLSQALALIRLGTQHADRGDYESATVAFRQSIDSCPTAEGLTYLGWMAGLKNDFEQAILYCKQAIQLDSEFGNAYNDIGAYLIGLNRFSEAEYWLEQAKQAVRYDAPHFPYLNLGRLYRFQGKTQKAISEYEMVIELCPGNQEAIEALSELYGSGINASYPVNTGSELPYSVSTEHNPFMVSFN